MLRNDRYTGVWRWNQCRWVRLAGQRTRSRVERPETEHLIREYPDLRIVPEALWQAVQDRRRRTNRRQGGRTAGATRVTKPSLLSGLLRCGVCAGSMTVRSQVHKRGKLYRCFGCTTRWTRGTAICGNSRMISELRLQKITLGALQRELLAPELVDRLVEAVEREYDDLHRADEGTRDLEQLLRGQEQRVRNATEALVRIGWSESVAAALKDEEAKLATLRARLADKRRTGPRRTLDPDLVRKYVHDLLDVLLRDAEQARALLARHMDPLVLTPTDEGGYRITGAFRLAAPGPADEPAPVLTNGSSGGKI